MNIAILSNVTVTSLAVRVNRVTGKDVYQPDGFNTWIQELTAPNSGLYASDARLVFVILHGASLFGDDGLDDAAHVLAPMAEAIANATVNHPERTFVASTLDIPHTGPKPLVSKRTELVAAAFWRCALEERGIPILELAEIAADMGRAQFYNNKVWYMGSMPFSQTGEEALALEITRIWRAVRGVRRKCLAIDLDNTLWGGVLGETGVDSIHLDRVGSGARFYDFQRHILDLKRQGVLLAILSKNNPEDALAAINTHPDMLLREGDFVAIRANWEQKPSNLESIADELNIGTDAFVFVDDNPIEQEAMRIALPEVAVPHFPEDTSKLVPFIDEVAREYFLQVRMTEEDAQKTDQYRAESERRTQQSAFGSVEEYLASLEMELIIEPLTEHNLPRAAQLTQKTNQFNLTTRRYTEADLREMQENPTVLVRIGSLSDRFGSYGKVVFCIVRKSGPIAKIDTFLMSCRVMGRGVENAFLASIEAELTTSGVETLFATYIPTPKNTPVQTFWEEMGYRETMHSTDDQPESRHYKTALPKPSQKHTIRIRREAT